MLGAALLLALLGISAVYGGKASPWEGASGRSLNLTAAQLAKLQALWDKYGPEPYQAPAGAEFPCTQIPASEIVPESVHTLRPGDIKVVAAMGDSLTAGTGIKALTAIGLLIKNRGYSWSGGGQTNYEDQITLPNILKKYNPAVYGFAVGDGEQSSSKSHFNVAVSGSTSSDLVNQAVELVARMRADPRVDFEHDWKLVTILSGNNDLCDYCNDPASLNIERFEVNTRAALDILHAELPRAIVNLVEPLNVEIVRELNKGLICSTLHFFTCDCAAFPASQAAEADLILEADRYQVTVERLAAEGTYDTREDFTVVSQPFFNQTYIPRRPDGQPDMAYFAPDCFHLSRAGQAAAASGLWNNMVERVGQKRTAWTPGEKIKCPTEEAPYFWTNKNSKTLRALHRSRQDSNPRPLDLQNTQQAAPGQGADRAATPALPVVLALALVAGVVAIVVVVRRRHKLRQGSYGPI